MRLARLVARDEERTARVIVRHRHARLGQESAWHQHLRETIKQRGLLGGEVIGIGVAACWNRVPTGAPAIDAVSYQFR